MWGSKSANATMRGIVALRSRRFLLYQHMIPCGVWHNDRFHSFNSAPALQTHSVVQRNDWAERRLGRPWLGRASRCSGPSVVSDFEAMAQRDKDGLTEREVHSCAGFI